MDRKPGEIRDVVTDARIDVGSCIVKRERSVIFDPVAASVDCAPYTAESVEERDNNTEMIEFGICIQPVDPAEY